MKRFAKQFNLLLLASFILCFPTLVSAATTSNESDPGLLIRKIMGLAYESNQTINSVPFAIGDSLKKVKKAWGPPEDESTVVSNYFSRYVSFHYNSKGKKPITAIRDYDPELQIIHLSDLKGLIGQPLSEVEQEGSYYVTYSANDDHKIIFEFGSIYGNPDPILYQYILEPK